MIKRRILGLISFFIVFVTYNVIREDLSDKQSISGLSTSDFLDVYWLIPKQKAVTVNSL